MQQAAGKDWQYIKVIGGMAMAAKSMNRNKVIELLEYYRKIDEDIEIYRSILRDLTNCYYNPLVAAQCDGQPKGQNNISRQTENKALNVPDGASKEIQSYERKIEILQKLKSQILQEVSCLRFKEKSIVFDFYISGLKWEQVAVHNHYSERQCKNIRNTAVESLIPRFQQNPIISNFEKIA